MLRVQHDVWEGPLLLSTHRRSGASASVLFAGPCSSKQRIFPDGQDLSHHISCHCIYMPLTAAVALLQSVDMLEEEQ